TQGATPLPNPPPQGGRGVSSSRQVASAPGGDAMRTTVFRSNGHEFVSLTGEAPAANTAGEEMTALVGQMEGALKEQGLGLADTVRTRLWARDRASRDEASKVRRQTFEGPLRSVSSSFIMSDIFASEARVAMDL